MIGISASYWEICARRKPKPCRRKHARRLAIRSLGPTRLLPAQAGEQTLPLYGAFLAYESAVSNRINVGALHERHVPLFTREVAAVMHEVASRLADGEEEGRAIAAPTIGELWVTDAGDLIIDQVSASESNLGREQTMNALAAMLESLLPTIRNQPDYAVPGSFRILAPRARGWPPGLPPIDTPQAFATAVARYRSGDTADVLRSLYERATPHVAPAVTAPAAASTTAAAIETDPLPLQSSASGTSPVTAVWVPPLPSTAPRRAPPNIWLLGALATAFAFVVAYEVARRVTPRPETARPAHEHAAAATASPVAESEVTIQESAVADAPRPAPPPARTSAISNATVTAATARSRGRSTIDTEAGDPMPPAPAPLPLAQPGPVFSPSFAATGSSLVFHAGRDPVAQLMTADLDDPAAPLEVLTVVGGTARNYHARVSPDGRYLAFDSDRDGERGVYVANRDGTDLRRVSGDGFAAVPSWSPDMRALAYVRAEPHRPQVWNLWRFDRATGRQTRVTSHRYGQTWGASWFPDSRRVCYSHEDRIVVLDMDTGDTHTYASPLPRRLLRTPAVSPDGRVIAFQVIRNGVWLLNLSDGAMRRLIEDPSAEEFAWSPDGRRLAYHSRRSGEWRIWIAAAPAPE
jgi:Tol biopolymer transport system component